MNVAFVFCNSFPLFRVRN